jgi:hypothetical protein
MANLRATHEGNWDFPLVDPGSGLQEVLSVRCANLTDGSRVINQSDFLELFARSPNVSSSNKKNTFANLPPFLSAGNLKPYTERLLTVSPEPIRYISKNNKRSKGYLADLVPQTCRIYKAAKKEGVLTKNQLHVFNRCDSIIDLLAGIAIAALIDEVTGYQYIRPENALQELLRLYVQSDPRNWNRQFSESFYEEVCRLRQWKYTPNKRTCAFGTITVDLVYKRIQPGLWEELKKSNPNKTKYRYHQMLTDNIGNPHLQKHLLSLIKLMKNCDSWKKFMYVVNISYPINNEIQTDIFFELLADNPEQFEQYMGFVA